MNSLLKISASGMQAAQTAARASALNVANLATAGFRREEVRLGAAPGGGVTATVSQAAQEGNSLEVDVVGQLAAKNQFLANLAVFRTGDRLLGSLLDVTR
jgi:flagellar hook protein FlgE